MDRKPRAEVVKNIPGGCPFSQTFPALFRPDIVRHCLLAKGHKEDHVVVDPKTGLKLACPGR